MDQPTPDEEASLVRNVRGMEGFTSVQQLSELGASRSSDLDLAEQIDNVYFKEMLNEHLSVWIEDWIFRVNPEDEKVYVIEASKYADKYDDLITQNIADDDVKAYSTGLNVLDVVRNPDLEPQALGCSASGIGAQYASQYLTDGTARLAHSDYAKYGIYFSLFTRIENIGSSSPVYRFDYSGSMWDGASHIYYKPRCGSVVDYSTTSTGTWGGTFFKYQSYQGSKALNEVYFYVKIRSNYAPYDQLAPQFGFRVNI